MRLLTLLILCLIASAAAQKRNTLDSVDASTPRDLQVKLALSAAPVEVGDKASVYVLGKPGYVQVRKGTNGFSCLIDREFVNTMEPECFDAEGTRTTLLTRLRTEELRSRGKRDDEINREIDAGYKNGKFHPPRKPGIVYMLSSENRVFDPDSKKIIRFPGHLMFYAPNMTAKDLGYTSNATLPYLVHPGRPDALMIVVPEAAGSHH